MGCASCHPHVQHSGLVVIIRIRGILTVPNLFYLLVMMDNTTGGSSQRPAKKRRTTKGHRGIREGDEITADGVVRHTITRHTEHGPVEEVHSRPVWLNEIP